MATPKLYPFWKLKKSLNYCPRGEQVENGGFETGDTTGWTTYSPVQSVYKHSGNYAIEIEFAGSRQCSQAFSPAIPVVCIDTFVAWYMKQGGYTPTLVIDYAEGGATHLSMDIIDGLWHQLNILAQLDPAKSVSNMNFVNAITYYLYVDDVSLIGKGGTY